MVGGDVTVAWMNHKYVQNYTFILIQWLEMHFIAGLVKALLMTTILTLKANVLAEEELALISMVLPQPPQ